MKREYRNSIRTKKMIREAFVALLNERKGLSDIKVAELAERADIAKSTFYNHYDDVYAVAEEMFDELVQNLNGIIDAMEADRATDYKIYLISIFEFLKQNEDTYRSVVNSPDARLFTDKIKFVIYHRLFSRSSVLVGPQSKTEKYLHVRFIINSCVDIMVDYFKGDIDMSLDDLAKSLLNLIDKIK